jgi:Tfp pilus assembly protein PilX
MLTRPTGPVGERGIALVMALLVLLVMSMLAAVLMMSVTTERKIAGHDLRRSQALNTAEAGVSEAMARLRNGDITLPTANPRAVAQIFNCLAGSVPAPGVDTTTMETKQPAGQWLPYSNATKGPDVLTVKFKTNPARTVVYKYDGSLNPAIQTASGMPIYVITATGKKGADVRRVVTEVIQKPFNSLVKAALAANLDIDFVGNAVVCGYNHSAATPTDQGENGRGAAPDCTPYETGIGNLPGSWTTGATVNGGAATQSGAPPVNASNQSGFYSGPWEALGMEQADYFSWVGVPQAGAPASINGIVYLDNNGTAQDQSGAWGFGGVTGEGLLYVDGDLTLNSTFVYRGLVYVEGDLKLNGQAWILGGLIVRGKSSVKMNGGATVLYSSDAIAQSIAKYGGQFVTLSWREQ